MAIRKKVVHGVLNKSRTLTDYTNINIDDFHKQHESRKRIVLNDESLTGDEKECAIRELNKSLSRKKILYNDGEKRVCENCKKECLATSYCEHCIQNYLKLNFTNWTSGNGDIDNLIQKYQLKTPSPSMVIEWIPYSNLQNIEYLTKGGFSEIYTAEWIDGCCTEWDSNNQLKRHGRHDVILKKLENVGRANQRWFDEAKSHLKISNKWSEIVQCYGLTQDPLSRNYMLVMDKMTTDLRTHLQQNHNQLTWKERLDIALNIIIALYRIHKENSIHRDLHSGNILYSQGSLRWCISDLGFCGPADKPSKHIYGNLPYIAPEVISGKNTATTASDVYSIAMLMWEISSGRPPFINHEHDYYLAMNIVNGVRPKIVSGTLPEYKKLMEQCWDADPSKRPDISTLLKNISEINLRYDQNTPNESINNNLKINQTISLGTSSRLFTSQVYQFENLPEPKNAIEGDQEAFHSKSYDDFYISDNSNTEDSRSKFSRSNSKNSAQNDYKKKQIIKNYDIIDLVKLDLCMSMVSGHLGIIVVT